MKPEYDFFSAGFTDPEGFRPVCEGDIFRLEALFFRIGEVCLIEGGGYCPTVLSSAWFRWAKWVEGRL